jgi:Cu/Ag efflux protein CusF
MMRKLLLAVICGLMLTLAGMALAASEANMVTGTVQKVDHRSGRVVIDGQTFVMKESGPLALVPQVGHKVTLFFDERNGQKVITRIGQAGRLSARTADLEASQ